MFGVLRNVVVRCSKRGLWEFHHLQYRSLGSVLPTHNGEGGYGDGLKYLQPKVASFIENAAELCRPSSIYVCDGSESEMAHLLDMMTRHGTIEPLPKMKNCFLALTDPADVARVESKTFIVTPTKRETIPDPAPGVEGTLGNWLSPEALDEVITNRFRRCMSHRTMYVIPFCMGPLDSSISKIGIQCTDSPYVAASMRIMTRMGSEALRVLGSADFVKCLHSVGCPLENKTDKSKKWPCNPEQTIITHVPETNEILSFGSGYGGNSLLGKKCLALRLGSAMAKKQNWLAEHMLILGVTNPEGLKRYIAAAFPSACGKTNLAMMTPSLPGYKVECVGDDIAWMRFDNNGVLRAINPENGFFGVAPGTSMKTNPNAMKTIQSNTFFTNVAKTDDGGVFWEGLEEEINPECQITSWKGKFPWQKSDGPAAHPNSRFCAPASQCPIMDPKWEDPEGVPISAILFGGRRPTGVPLVYQAFDWKHGVMIGASMRSEATAAAEHSKKVIMHDPFAMRPFLGYNFGHYLKHWLTLEDFSNSLPKVFHVNWFRKDSNGNYLWPGFGENIRVLDWVMQRLEGADVADESAIGYIPKPGSINLEGLDPNIDMAEVFSVPKEFWQQEVKEIKKYLSDQVGDDTPQAVLDELEKLRNRLQLV